MSSIEQRQYQRVQFFAKVTLTPAGGKTIEGNSIDLSLGGIGVMSPKFIAVGQTVSVGFQTTDRAKGKIVVEEAMGKVIRTRSDEQCTLVVVQFLEPLSRALNPRVVAKLEASFS